MKLLLNDVPAKACSHCHILHPLGAGWWTKDGRCHVKNRATKPKNDPDGKWTLDKPESPLNHNHEGVKGTKLSSEHIS